MSPLATMGKKISTMSKVSLHRENYNSIHVEIVELLKAARSASARSLNAIMTATYWAIGRRIVQAEQRGQARAEYGKQLVEQLAQDLVKQFGRGFSQPNLWRMCAFYQAWPEEKILSILSRESSRQLVSNDFNLLPSDIAASACPLLESTIQCSSEMEISQ